jgi:hypothetical protein
MITFTTTATIRPELINQTYENFSKNLIGINLKECELVINVDPMPVDQLKDREKVIEVAKKYFGKVTYRFPEKPNFPDALRWCWSNTSTKYVFNLEYEWVLLSKVNIKDLISLHNKDKSAIGVSLNAYLFGLNPFRIRLSPCLLDGNWARQAAAHLSPAGCPERQLRNKIPKHLIRRMLNYPAYSNPKLGKIIVRDTGRAWRESKKLIKNNGGESGFTTWKKG